MRINLALSHKPWIDGVSENGVQGNIWTDERGSGLIGGRKNYVMMEFIMFVLQDMDQCKSIVNTKMKLSAP
jgi:hypothetical protein